MRIKNRDETLQDIIKDASQNPTNWKAVCGKDYHHLSDDYYLFHPNVGLYLLKQYQKNPYAVKGVGGKIARHVDKDLEQCITDLSGSFGIIQGDIKKIASHLQKGARPETIINAAIQGKDMGLTLPLQGTSSISEESFSTLKDQHVQSRKKLNHEFEKIVKQDGIYSSYE